MISLKIINSARFLKMPIDSQVLYFHLIVRADDDGIVEAYTLMRLTGSTEDNLKVLVAKGFIKILNDDLVTFITDWTEHNLIRADRKIDSIYKNLLIQIVPDAKIQEAKPRADTKKLTGQQMDDQVSAQVKLSKVKLSKDKVSKVKYKEVPFFLTAINNLIISFTILLYQSVPKASSAGSSHIIILFSLFCANLIKGSRLKNICISLLVLLLI